jgi:hypothetical protein
VVSVQLPESTTLPLLHRSHCMSSSHHRRTTPFSELPHHVSLFHLPVLWCNPNPFLGM